jgi:hypothetical protein
MAILTAVAIATRFGQASEAEDVALQSGSIVSYGVERINRSERRRARRREGAPQPTPISNANHRYLILCGTVLYPIIVTFKRKISVKQAFSRIARLSAFERAGVYSLSRFRRGRLSRLLATSASPLEGNSSKNRQLFPVQVSPLPAIKYQVGEVPPQSSIVSRTSFAEQRALVDRLDRSLQLIFWIEYVALSEYLECVIPVVYAILLAVMRQLPIIAFHPELAALSEHTMSSMFFYWIMEVLSLLLLTTMLYRRGGINVLYHVAFVLETHAALVQGKLVTWMLIAFESQGTHFGALDFARNIVQWFLID